jgi:hypothetical protein
MKIGKAKFGFTQKKYFKLKDGDSTFRILPPMGELADEGRWSMFYKIHYGYKNTKGKLRVFQSSLVVNRKTKMVEVPDAADQRIKDLKAKLEAAKAAGQKQVVEKLGPLVSGQKPMYNVDSNHYLNVIDTQGNIGVLKLRHRAKTALDVQIKKLREKGIDPLSVDNGRFFVFTRSGTGLDTSFQVDIQQEKLTVQGVGEVNRDVVHKLSEELIARLAEEAGQLDKLFRALTSDEIERIVKSSDLLTGQSAVIDELFDNKGDTSGGGEGEEGADDAGDESADDTAAKASAAASEAAAAQAASDAKAKADAQAAAKAASDAKIAAEVKAKNDAAATAAASTPAVTTSAPANQTTAEAVSDMSDDEFLKSLGL